MKLDAQGLVWNRAALDGGGTNARVGDRALADALKAHVLVMSGGVHHAVEVLSDEEVEAAVGGFQYLGLRAIAELLCRVRPGEWSEATEEEANREYWAVLPDDAALIARFGQRFRDRRTDFAPVQDATNAV